MRGQTFIWIMYRFLYRRELLWALSVKTVRVGQAQISTVTYVNSVGIILAAACMGYIFSCFVTCRIFASKEY